MRRGILETEGKGPSTGKVGALGSLNKLSGTQSLEFFEDLQDDSKLLRRESFTDVLKRMVLGIDGIEWLSGHERLRLRIVRNVPVHRFRF